MDAASECQNTPLNSIARVVVRERQYPALTRGDCMIVPRTVLVGTSWTMVRE